MLGQPEGKVAMTAATAAVPREPQAPAQRGTAQGARVVVALARVAQVRAVQARAVQARVALPVRLAPVRAGRRLIPVTPATRS
jgi:hypothetical protein